MFTVNDRNAPYIRAARHLSRDKILPGDTLEKLLNHAQRPEAVAPAQMHVVADEVQTLTGCCKALSHTMPDMIDFQVPLGKPENIARMEASANQAGFALVGMRMIANILPSIADGSRRPNAEDKKLLAGAVSQKDKPGLFVTPLSHLKTLAFVMRHSAEAMKSQSPDNYQFVASQFYTMLHPDTLPDPQKAYREFPESCERLAAQYDFTIECLEKMQKAYDEQMGKAVESARAR